MFLEMQRQAVREQTTCHDADRHPDTVQSGFGVPGVFGIAGFMDPVVEPVAEGVSCQA